MQVKDRMTPDPIVVMDTTPFEDALRLMRDKKVRRLPVVDKYGRLVGIVAERDLLYASPSPATSLSVFEIHYLLAKMTVQEVMTKRVITVGEDCPLEEAARIMVDHKIGSLLVVTGGKLMGIITETDIFKTFVEILGGREPGLRLTLDVTEGKGVLAMIASEITRAGGNILSVATFQAPDATQRIVYVKVTGAAKEALLK
ncbi:MAG: CBS domain-containing protein, partial [Chloroflexota bacterium]|nr:CBS domain-containing protein [Chloroflexota bacterium]